MTVCASNPCPLDIKHTLQRRQKLVMSFYQTSFDVILIAYSQNGRSLLTSIRRLIMSQWYLNVSIIAKTICVYNLLYNIHITLTFYFDIGISTYMYKSPQNYSIICLCLIVFYVF